MMPSEHERVEIFYQCWQAIEQDRATVDECVARYPEVGGLREMLEATALARQLPRPSLVSPRKALLAQQLVAQMNARKPAQSRLPPYWLRRTLAGAAVLILLITSGIVLLGASAF